MCYKHHYACSTDVNNSNSRLLVDSYSSKNVDLHMLIKRELFFQFSSAWFRGNDVGTHEYKCGNLFLKYNFIYWRHRFLFFNGNICILFLPCKFDTALTLMFFYYHKERVESIFFTLLLETNLPVAISASTKETRGSMRNGASF